MGGSQTHCKSCKPDDYVDFKSKFCQGGQKTNLVIKKLHFVTNNYNISSKSIQRLEDELYPIPNTSCDSDFQVYLQTFA